MEKEVLVCVSGLQVIDQNQEAQPLEIITPGEYFRRNEKDYILYDEVTEGFDGVTKNRIKIGENSLEIVKKGVSNAHMVFEPGKQSMTCYDTPFGSIVLGIRGGNVEISRSENVIDVQADYRLEVEDVPFADCRIHINIQPRQSG